MLLFSWLYFLPTATKVCRFPQRVHAQISLQLFRSQPKAACLQAVFSLSAEGFLNCDSQATASEICRWLITSLSSCSVKRGIARRGLVLQIPSLAACPPPTKLGTWAPGWHMAFQLAVSPSSLPSWGGHIRRWEITSGG